MPPRGAAPPQWNDRGGMQQPWMRASMNQFRHQGQGMMNNSIQPPMGKQIKVLFVTYHLFCCNYFHILQNA